jgi:hypothetical protein
MYGDIGGWCMVAFTTLPRNAPSMGFLTLPHFPVTSRHQHQSNWAFIGSLSNEAVFPSSLVEKPTESKQRTTINFIKDHLKII